MEKNSDQQIVDVFYDQIFKDHRRSAINKQKIRTMIELAEAEARRVMDEHKQKTAPNLPGGDSAQNHPRRRLRLIRK